MPALARESDGKTGIVSLRGVMILKSVCFSPPVLTFWTWPHPLVRQPRETFSPRERVGSFADEDGPCIPRPSFP